MNSIVIWTNLIQIKLVLASTQLDPDQFDPDGAQDQPMAQFGVVRDAVIRSMKFLESPRPGFSIFTSPTCLKVPLRVLCDNLYH